MSKTKEVLLNPIFNDNPIALQILGICSALAITGSLYPTLIMCVALTVVVSFSSLLVSLIRKHVPNNIRIIVQMTIIATLVMLVDELLQAFDYETSRTLVCLCRFNNYKLHRYGKGRSLCYAKWTLVKFC